MSRTLKRILLILAATWAALAVFAVVIVTLYVQQDTIHLKPHVLRSAGTQVPLYPLQSVAGPDEPIERLMAVHVHLDGRAGLFLVDTGASAVTVSRRFARAIGVKSPRPVHLQMNFGVSEVEVFRARALRIGEVTYRDFDVLILELQHIQDWTHTDLDGILGGNVLNALPYELDFAARRLTIGRGLAVSSDDAVPLTIQDGLILAEATVNGRPNRFILDTGASNTLIRSDDLDRLFAPEKPPLTSLPVRIVDIKQDQVTEHKEVVLPDVRLGDAMVRDLKAGLFEQNLLGQDFLARFTLRVDAPHRRLALVKLESPAGNP